MRDLDIKAAVSQGQVNCSLAHQKRVNIYHIILKDALPLFLTRFATLFFSEALKDSSLLLVIAAISAICTSVEKGLASYSGR